MKKYMIIGTVAASALLLTACGSGGSPEVQAATDDDVITVKVASQAIANTAPIWLGEEQGFFDDHGINLELQAVESGAHIPGVISGSFDFAFSNTVSAMMASDNGLDVRFVVGAASSNSEIEGDTDGVLVPADSDIKSASDLEGKRVAVTNLTSLGSTTIRAAVENAGADPSKVEFVEVNFADSEAAMSNDQVDAAWLTEPFKTRAIANGAKVISYNYKETHPNLDMAAYVATGDFIDKNPEAVKRFQAAMAESLAYAQSNPDETKEIIKTYTEIDEATLAELTLPEFRAELNREAMEVVADAVHKYGAVKSEVDLDKLLP